MAPREDQSTQSSSASSAASPSTSHGGSLELSSPSHSIAKKQQKKLQPIIRVVHVFAPKLIKTDPANFRALVQKLTGNKAPAAKHEEEMTANDHGEPHNCSDYHENTNQQCFANHNNYEEIRVLESSSRPPKKVINPRRRKLPISAIFNTANEIEALQAAQNRKDAGFLLRNKFCGLARINGDREGDNPGLASIDDCDRGAIYVANHHELAGNITHAEDITDEYFEYKYMSSPSSLGATSSCNTESAMPFEEREYCFDEGLEVMGSFINDIVNEHRFMHLDNYQSFLHPTFL